MGRDKNKNDIIKYFPFVARLITWALYLKFNQ